MRPINQVIDALIKIIPADFESRPDMVNDLRKVQESVPYTAPEAMKIRWDQVANILGDYLGDPRETPWKTKVAEVFMAKIDYQEVLKES